MLKFSRLIVLGLLFAAPAARTSPPKPPIAIPVKPPAPPSMVAEDLNSFVNLESQYCRPFLRTHNPRVVKIEHRIKMPSAKEAATWRCTGVVVGPRTVLTAKHCVEHEENGVKGDLLYGTVITSEGEVFPITLRSPDPKDDIVMLQVDRPLGIAPARIADKTPMALTLEGYGCIRDSVTDYPLQRSAVSLFEDDTTLFISGCICHGDSGGPIFDDEGRLVALMSQTDNDGKGGRGVLVQGFMSGRWD